MERHRETVTGKLGEARRLLSRLTAEERERIGAGPDRASRAPGARDDLAAAASARAPGPGRRPPWRTPTTSSAALRLGATGPDAFDCSGLIQAAYRSAGVSLPRTTYAQIDAGRRVARSELLPATWCSSTPVSATSASTSATAG